MHRCPDCFKEYSDDILICPECGCEINEKTKEIYHMSPGTILKEKYYIGKVIGYGGFGVIYKAWDLTLGQVVAIKEYYPTMYLVRDSETNNVHIYDSKNEEIFEREKAAFLSEARNIAKYNNHPSIVHIFDYFEENGTAYFVMEYLDGFSLRECNTIANKNGLVVDINSAVKITVAILDALAIVHKDDIIHRDIKPNNIFVLKDGSIKLFDFGAARFVDDKGENTKTVIFTPGYAPPEQYETKSKQGAFTDIYAVGAILYELVTGKRLEESINRKVYDSVKPPEEYNKAVPEYLSNAIMRAIAISPEIRFQTADEFRDILLFAQVARSAKQEIGRRNTKRNARIAGIVLVILCFIGLAGKTYMDKKVMAGLYETTISVWMPKDFLSGENTPGIDIIREALSEFETDYPDVKLEFVEIDSQDYEQKLIEAFEAGNAPDVFESSSLSEQCVIYMADISTMLEECRLDEDTFYGADYFTNSEGSIRQFPASFNAEAIYVNSLENLYDTSEDYRDFCEGKSNYSGTVLDYDRVVQDMPGRFEVSKPDKKNPIHYNQTWSVNVNIKKYQQIAARRVIGYLLSDSAQEVFSIENNVGLPVKQSILEDYLEIYSNFDYVTDYLKN